MWRETFLKSVCPWRWLIGGCSGGGCLTMDLVWNRAIGIWSVEREGGVGCDFLLFWLLSEDGQWNHGRLWFFGESRVVGRKKRELNRITKLLELFTWADDVTY